jgi:hypothetical protein
MEHLPFNNGRTWDVFYSQTGGIAKSDKKTIVTRTKWLETASELSFKHNTFVLDTTAPSMHDIPYRFSLKSSSASHASNDRSPEIERL